MLSRAGHVGAERHGCAASPQSIRAARGLLDFVQAYRSFATLAGAGLAPVDVRTLLDRVRLLVSRRDRATGISVSGACSQPDLTVRADAGQIGAGADQPAAQCRRSAGETAGPRIELRGAARRAASRC